MTVAAGRWRLTRQALIRIQGPDARAFLHGQLTSAVATLDDTQARPAAWCTAQGRLLANGPIWQTAADSFDWLIAHDLLEPMVRRLRLFVLRARVTISAPSGFCVAAALGGGVPPALQALPSWAMACAEGRRWIVAPMSTPAQPAAWSLGQEVLAGAVDDDGTWAAARLAGGWPRVRAATSERFLPSALDMDLNGTIDFRKGCYPGQEVIARSHYRGTIKRRMAHGILPPAQAALADPDVQDLYAVQEPDRGPVSRIIESVRHAGALHFVAEITVSDDPRSPYAWGSPDGPAVTLRRLQASADIPPRT